MADKNVCPTLWPDPLAAAKQAVCRIELSELVEAQHRNRRNSSSPASVRPTIPPARGFCPGGRHKPRLIVLRIEQISRGAKPPLLFQRACQGDKSEQRAVPQSIVPMGGADCIQPN